MQFLKEIEAHLLSFETTAKEEIQKFISYLHSKYQPVTDAVVPPPAPLNESTPTPAPVFTATETITPPPAVEPEPVQSEPVQTETKETTVDIPAETTVEAEVTPAPTTCTPSTAE